MRAPKVWQGGVLLMACNFLVALGNYAFQGVIGRQLPLVEYGYANAAAGAVLLLSLPVMASSNALTHYVARFRASGQEAELQGLVSSTRKWLGLVAGSGFVLALLLTQPLATYCGFPRPSLVVAMVVNMTAMLGIAFVTALCTGMGWYARLGLIAVGGMIVKLVSVWTVTRGMPLAEGAVAATAASAGVYAVILFWWKDVSGAGERINPLNREFGLFALAALASAFGSFAFTQSDILMAQRNLPAEAVGYFCAAGVFARGMLGLTGPLLMVFFATRSAGAKHASDSRTYFILIGLYLLIMSLGAIAITVLREPLTHSIFGRPEPAAAALVGRFALLILAIGAIEILGSWALASRWFGVVHAQFGLGVLYVAVGLVFGTDPSRLLSALLAAATTVLAVLLGICVICARRTRPLEGSTFPRPPLQPLTP
ncbi:MAG: hypothetical protein H0W20_13205 [Chthoniobacterales bacterium]|nr:hypothetical protein [Chthoniobacterales bacterium]